MKKRSVRTLCAVAPTLMVMLLGPTAVGTQTQGPEADAWTAARTPWGDPDLQGVWTNATRTPLERPLELEGREFLTDAEVAELEAFRFDPSRFVGAVLAARRSSEEHLQDPADGPPSDGGTGTVAQFWFDQPNQSRRTSLIVDPPDGRIPPMTPEGEKRAAWKRGTDSWENRNLAERCITRGAPRRPSGYNNNYMILQAPGHVVIVQEMIHDVRFIALDGRPHLDPNIRLWLGDSRGRWEGETLVVETTNFNDKIAFNSFNCCEGAGQGLRIVERFTRVSADTIDYQYTVDDPTTYVRAWTASIPMSKTQGPVFEYACHEGNHAIANILRTARAQDEDEDEAAVEATTRSR